MTTLMKALWQRYRRDGDAAAREELLSRYLGLVRHCAREIANRTGGLVEVDDLVSAGTIGLVKALESFDLDRGLAFSTYAMPRIRGAILDELRAIDWIPRSVRAKGRHLQNAVAMLERTLARPPQPAEVAAAMGIAIEAYWRLREEVSGGTLVSLDRVDGSAERGTPLLDILSDPDASAPDDVVTKAEGIHLLRQAIGDLPDRERTVLALYYFENLNLRQIAQVLHVTESRISQIRTQAIKGLRRRFVPVEAV